MKRFINNNFEAFVVVTLFAVFGLLKIVLANKVAMLNLYFIPVLISGYYLGKRRAILSAIASVLLATLFFVRWPEELVAGSNELYAGLNLVVWASLLVLTSIMVTTLNESRQHRKATATFKLLEKYIRDVAAEDNHPARVGKIAKAVAKEIKLHPRLVESVEAAALLHDIGDSDAGLDLITECGEAADSMDKSVIDEALPILIKRHSIENDSNKLPIGSRIINIADTYDSVATANPDNEIWQLIEKIEETSNKRDAKVVSALARVLGRKSA